MAGRVGGKGLAGTAATALAAALLVATAIAPGGDAAGPGTLELKKVGEFRNPVHVENAPGEPKLLFVVEQAGTVRVVRRGKTLARPFFDLADAVTDGGEQGLLSIAFGPGYARNRRFYVYYVDGAGDIRVDQMRRKRSSAVRADLGSRRRVIGIPHPVNTNHNGGQLQFGPDGLLYLGTGDGGGAGDQPDNAQNPEVLLGKLLRIDPGRRGGYAIPKDNPFASSPGADEIFALGLRNPYRFSFDSRTSDLWIGDVGQNQFEEIDHVGLAGARGANFGWDLFEGDHAFEGDGTEPPGYRPPVLEFSHAGGNCAVTGGYVVRDPGLPALEGRYVYADFCGGVIRSFDAAASSPAATDAPTGLTLDQVSSFGEGVRHRIYVTSLSGPVYRIAQ